MDVVKSDWFRCRLMMDGDTDDARQRLKSVPNKAQYDMKRCHAKAVKCFAALNSQHTHTTTQFSRSRTTHETWSGPRGAMPARAGSRAEVLLVVTIPPFRPSVRRVKTPSKGLSRQDSAATYAHHHAGIDGVPHSAMTISRRKPMSNKDWRQYDHRAAACAQHAQATVLIAAR